MYGREFCLVEDIPPSRVIDLTTNTEVSEFFDPVTGEEITGSINVENRRDYVYLSYAFSSSNDNTPPIARILSSDSEGMAPLTVNFDGYSEDGTLSYDPDGDEIVSYFWNFGDGPWAWGPEVTHEYVTPGVYSAKLTVTDEHGASSSTAVIISVDTEIFLQFSGGVCIIFCVNFLLVLK